MYFRVYSPHRTESRGTKTRFTVGARSLARNTLGEKGHAGVSGWGLRKMTSKSIIHINLHKPNNKLVNA
jgi:hypothetical protein